MNKIIFVLGLIICFATSSFTQTDAVAELEQTIQDWTKAYEKLPQTRKIESILSFYTKDYKASRNSYKITGRLEQQPADYSTLKGLLENIIKFEQLKTQYNIKDTYKIGVAGSIGYAVINADFALYNGDKLVAKGEEVQTLIFRKEDKKWKIAHADILNIVEEQKRSICGCTIFVGTNNEYIAKVQRPNGKEYIESLNQFMFQFKRDGTTVIYSDNNKKFEWLTTKDVYYGYGNREEQVLLGTERSERGAILAILKNFLYKDYCSELRPNPEKKDR